MDLRRVAEWTDSSIDEIQALNPELRRWTTPVRDKKYELKVPAGTAEKVSARLADAPAVDLASLKYYTVKQRRDAAADRAQAARQQGRPRRSELPARRRARVRRSEADGAERSAGADGGADGSLACRPPRRAPPSLTPGQLAEPAANSNRVKGSYAVKRGDTLASIARLYQTTVASIKTWNPRLPGERLAAGQRLTVYRLAN